MDAIQIPIDLVLERPQSKDVVRGLLHSILFHRLFGTVKPQTIDVLDITFPGVADPEIESKVNAKVDEFCNAIDGLPGGNGVVKKGRIIITLSEKRVKKQWFSLVEEEVPWERWIVTIQLLPKSSVHGQNHQPVFPPTTQQQSLTPTPLSPVLMQILGHVSSVKGRDAVPPILTGNVISPFPLKIDVSVDR